MNRAVHPSQIERLSFFAMFACGRKPASDLLHLPREGRSPISGALGSGFQSSEDVCGDHLQPDLELDPLYCDVIVERWEKFTGGRRSG